MSPKARGVPEANGARQGERPWEKPREALRFFWGNKRFASQLISLEGLDPSCRDMLMEIHGYSAKWSLAVQNLGGANLQGVGTSPWRWVTEKGRAQATGQKSQPGDAAIGPEERSCTSQTRCHDDACNTPSAPILERWWATTRTPSHKQRKRRAARRAPFNNSAPLGQVREAMPQTSLLCVPAGGVLSQWLGEIGP